jgi:NAD-dependent dihydropyrimidine dehydrogenase PreA subunit
MPPKIDKAKCIGCGACIGVCPQGVLALKGGKSVVAAVKKCIECRACEAVCPKAAITF